MLKCPVCQSNQAEQHPVYGVLPCLSCKGKREKNSLPDKQPEMVGLDIKDNQRKTHAKSIIQPRRGGELSKEYLDLYGKKNIQATPQEIKKAKNVWGDIYSDNFNLKKTK